MKIDGAIPLYSQYRDIQDPYWKSRGCGITALKMLADAYSPQSRFSKKPLNDVVLEGVAKGAYIPKIGWSHSGLASLSKYWNLSGKNYDWHLEKPVLAFRKMQKFLIKGPLLASIHKNFNKKNNGHIIVILQVDGNEIFLLDPAAKTRENILQKVSVKKFLGGWKRRIVTIHPRIAEKKKR